MSLTEKAEMLGMTPEERAQKALNDAKNEQADALTKLEEAKYNIQKDIQSLNSEISLIQKKAFTFDELITYLKTLHEAGGDDAVVSYLLIYGKIAEIDDRLDELKEIEEALWNYDSQLMFDYNDLGKTKCPELDRIIRRKAELQKQRNNLTSSIGFMSDGMFGYKKRHSKYRRY